MILQLPLMTSPVIYVLTCVLLFAVTCLALCIYPPNRQSFFDRCMIGMKALQSLYRSSTSNTLNKSKRRSTRHSVAQVAPQQDATSHQIKKSSGGYLKRKRPKSPISNYKSRRKTQKCPKKNYKMLFPLDSDKSRKDRIVVRPSKEIFGNTSFLPYESDRAIFVSLEQLVRLSAAEYDYYLKIQKDDCSVSVDVNHGDHYDALCQHAEIIKEMKDDLNTLINQLQQVNHEIINTHDSQVKEEIKKERYRLKTTHNTIIESLNKHTQAYYRLRQQFDKHSSEKEPILMNQKTAEIKDVVEETRMYYTHLQNAFSQMMVYDANTKNMKVASHTNTISDANLNASSIWENSSKILPVWLRNKNSRLSALIINGNINKIYLSDQQLDSKVIAEVLAHVGGNLADYSLIKCYNEQQCQRDMSIVETVAFLGKGLEMVFSSDDAYEQRESTFINTIRNKSNDNFSAIGNGFLLHKKGKEINIVAPSTQDNTRQDNAIRDCAVDFRL